jgi:RimJ/RimL family protein N-acetyltransferase
MAAVAETLSSYTEDAFGLWNGDLVVSEKVSDDLLAYAYMRFDREGLLPYLFYEGPSPGVKWFLDTFTDPKMDVLGCFERGADGKLTLAGLTWFNSKTHVAKVFTRSECGQGFFRDYHDRDHTCRWARLSARYAFKFLKVDIIYGTTPVKNRAAVIAAKRTGFQVVGELPMYTLWEGEPCAAVISCLTPERLDEVEKHGSGDALSK